MEFIHAEREEDKSYRLLGQETEDAASAPSTTRRSHRGRRGPSAPCLRAIGSSLPRKTSCALPVGRESRQAPCQRARRTGRPPINLSQLTEYRIFLYHKDTPQTPAKERSRGDFVPVGGERLPLRGEHARGPAPPQQSRLRASSCSTSEACQAQAVHHHTGQMGPAPPLDP